MPYERQKPLEKSQLSLFSEKTANDKAPIMRGTVELVLDDLRWAVAQAKENKEIKFRVSVWKKFPKNGGTAYLSGIVEKDVPFQGGKKGGGIPGLDFDEPSDDISL